MAQRVEALLRATEMEVVITLQTVDRVASAQVYATSTHFTQLAISRVDLQARVDIANSAGPDGGPADLFVSIHSNAAFDNSARGIETWWDPNRPWSADNLRLAQLLTSHVVN